MKFVGNQRFLYPQHQPAPVPGPSALVDDDDGLGPLPSGWERRVQPDGKYYFSFLQKVFALSYCWNKYYQT